MAKRRDRRQLDLFEPASPSGPEPEEDEAPKRGPFVAGGTRPDPRLRDLAARLPAHVRLGTSSWTFPGWAGIVYHRRYRSERAFVRESLAEYAQHPLFRTVGIDRSYYGPLEAKELAAYAAQLPAGFRCVSKAWNEITTPGAKHWLDASVFADQVTGPMLAAFSVHAGPIVLEIPRTDVRLDPDGFARDLERFLARAADGLRYAVEVRDPKLMTKRYFDVLRDRGATHVFVYWSRMPTLGEQLDRDGSMPGPFVVARLLLPPGRSYEQERERFRPFDRLQEPQAEMRDDVVRLVRTAGNRGFETYVLVNNKAEGSAPETVRALAERLGV